jgi:pantetheine-phosphate adenylyltransferase
MHTVMLPGTFDPPTNGHLDILQRASRLFEAVVVVVAVNPGKANLFSSEERFAMMKALSADLPNVTVSLWDGLIVDYAAQHGIHLIVRGVRALADFDYEFELAAMNRSLNPRAETILMPTDQRYSVLRSSVVKDIARFGGAVTSMVPPIVAEALHRKFGKPAARTAPFGARGAGAGDS